MRWRTVERPGYLGKKRDDVIASWDQKFGRDNWRLAYQWGNLIVPREMGLQIYEDGYYEFLRNNPDTLDWLISSSSDVYDTAESNIQSGLDYSVQETPNSHIHDISVRRAVTRLGFGFRGDHLMHIRGKGTEGERLSPGIVPFHLPRLIVSEEVKDYGAKSIWWNDKSIEDFYQRNKVLQVNSSF